MLEIIEIIKTIGITIGILSGIIVIIKSLCYIVKTPIKKIRIKRNFISELVSIEKRSKELNKILLDTNNHTTGSFCAHSEFIDGIYRFKTKPYIHHGFKTSVYDLYKSNILSKFKNLSGEIEDLYRSASDINIWINNNNELCNPAESVRIGNKCGHLMSSVGYILKEIRK